MPLGCRTRGIQISTLSRTISIIAASAMSDAAARASPAKGNQGPRAKRPQPPPKREVRILMLHGYTQSGPLFRAKVRGLEKLLAKALAPAGLVPLLSYPTAPVRLDASQIPGYAPRPSTVEASENEEEAEELPDAWAWFLRDAQSGSYRHLGKGMRAVAAAIRNFERDAVTGTTSASASGTSTPAEVAGDGGNGGTAAGKPIDGVIGFSQGGALAALVASALEVDDDHGRVRPRRTNPPVAEWEDSWLRELREANRGQPLRFCVVYSGFFAPASEMRWFYEPPPASSLASSSADTKDDGDASQPAVPIPARATSTTSSPETAPIVPGITTPTLHFLGSLDTVVEESRSTGLVDRCVDPVVVRHPGGHHVPVAREWATPLVGFVRKCLEEAIGRREPGIDGGDGDTPERL